MTNRADREPLSPTSPALGHLRQPHLPGTQARCMDTGDENVDPVRKVWTRNRDRPSEVPGELLARVAAVTSGTDISSTTDAQTL